MRKKERDKRTYLIIGLCAVLVVMTVGFAAFSQQLQINGTSEITSNWNVHIVSITPTIPTGSGATNDTTGITPVSADGLTATFKTNLVSPGDTIKYDVLVKNFGSLNAKLDSINENVTTSNSAIEYALSGARQGEVLLPNGETHLYVDVTYKNSVTSQPGSTTWGLELKLNYSQTNDAPVVPGFTGVLYVDPSNFSYDSVDWVGYEIGQKVQVEDILTDVKPSYGAKLVIADGILTKAYVIYQGNEYEGGSPEYFAANKAQIESLNGGKCGSNHVDSNRLDGCSIGDNEAGIEVYPNGDIWSSDGGWCYSKIDGSLLDVYLS